MNGTSRNVLRWSVLAALLVLATSSHAADGPVFVASDDGKEVLSPYDGLAWDRCFVGQRWNGRLCTGIPALIDHAQAEDAVRQRNAAAEVGWRLPSVGELRRLVQRRHEANVEGRRLLPEPALGLLWSSSTRVDTSSFNQYAYQNIQRGISPGNVNRLSFLHRIAVDTDSGEALLEHKSARVAVRLVRSVLPVSANSPAASAKP